MEFKMNTFKNKLLIIGGILVLTVGSFIAGYRSQNKPSWQGVFAPDLTAKTLYEKPIKIGSFFDLDECLGAGRGLVAKTHLSQNPVYRCVYDCRFHDQLKSKICAKKVQLTKENIQKLAEVK